MKTASVTIGLMALLLVSAAMAQDITISWLVTDKKISTGYLPKLASDGIQNVVTIDEVTSNFSRSTERTGINLSVFESQIGTIDEYSVSWASGTNYLYSPPQKTPQIGHAPSIALGYDGADNYDDAIEVHQGGQDKEGSLWFQLGTNSPPSFSKIVWGPSKRYGTGYNPTVAADLNGPPAATTTAVVEVHQEAIGVSALWYKVGVLTLGPSPSISWGPTLEINGGLNPGYVPTVSVANKLAVLVAEGSGGTLWYAVGDVDTATSTINWTEPIPYGGTGYNPTVSVFGDGSDDISPGRAVVEAHQMDSGTGPLVYSTAIVKNGTMGLPPTLTWSNTGIPYSAGGCYPSVALSFDGYTPPNQDGNTSNLSVTETHETACGTATVDYSFGYLVAIK